MTKDEFDQSLKDIEKLGKSVGEKAGKVLTVYGWVTTGKDMVNDIGVMAGIWEEERDPIKDALTEINQKLDTIIGQLNDLIEDTHDIFDAVVISNRQAIIREMKSMSIDIENITETAVEYANMPNNHPDKQRQYELMFAQKTIQESLLETLQDESYFQFLYNERWAYHNWQNKIMPPPEISDYGKSTWGYRYTLPLLQKAILDRLLFISVLYPNYRNTSHYESDGGRCAMEDIYKAVSTLIQTHEKIADAIKEEPCPTLEQLRGYARYRSQPPTTGLPYNPDLISSPTCYQLDWRPIFYNEPNYYRIGEAHFYGSYWGQKRRLYGAVECYSTKAQVDTFLFTASAEADTTYPYWNNITPIGFPQLPPLLINFWNWGQMHQRYETLDAAGLAYIKETISGDYHIEYDYFKTQNWTLLETQRAIFNHYHLLCEKAYYDFFLRKHTVRSYAMRIKVYQDVNLGTLWKFIEALKEIGGPNLVRYAHERNRKPLQERTKSYLEAWSLRHIADILTPWYPRATDQPISLRKLILTIEPNATLPLSLRAALES